MPAAGYNAGPVAAGQIVESAVVNDNSGNLLTVANADSSATVLALAKQAADTPARVGTLGVSQGLTAGGSIKSGEVTGLSAGAAGVVTAAVNFAAPFPTALDNVVLTIRAPSSQGIGFGGVWTTAEGTGGFTINVAITTAVAGATFSVGWVAFGH
jgi:hypothetical protein